MITAAKLSIIGRRLLQTVPVIVLSTFIVFGLLKLVPGDVAVTLAGDNASEQRITEIREIYGLDTRLLLLDAHRFEFHYCVCALYSNVTREGKAIVSMPYCSIRS